MIAVVLDCGVLVSAVGWGGNPANAVALVAAGQADAIVSDDIWREYEKRIPEVLAKRRPEAKAGPFLAWLLTVARFVSPAPLGKQRSRDAKNDPHLAAALAAGAVLVTHDRDLLDLGKPFGVAIVTPIDFIKRVRSATLS